MIRVVVVYLNSINYKKSQQKNDVERILNVKKFKGGTKHEKIIIRIYCNSRNHYVGRL